MKIMREDVENIAPEDYYQYVANHGLKLPKSHSMGVIYSFTLHHINVM
jgi:hypothetical protein